MRFFPLLLAIDLPSRAASTVILGKFTYPNSGRANRLNRQVEPHVPILPGCLQQAEIFGLAQFFFLIAEGLPLLPLSGLTPAVPGPLKS